MKKKLKGLWLLLLFMGISLILFSKDGGHEYTRRVDSLETLISKSIHDTTTIDLLLQLSKNCLEEDEPKALQCLARALDLSRKNKDKNRESWALHLLGQNHLNHQELKEALKYYLQSQNIAEQTGDKEIMAANLSDMGLIYLRMNRLDIALPKFQRAYEYAAETKDTVLMMQTSGNLGSCYKEQGDYTSAIGYQEKIYDISLARKDKVGMAYSLNNIGDIYLAMGQKSKSRMDFKNAITYFQRSLKIKKELDNKRMMASTLGGIGSVYQQTGQFDSSLFYLKATEDIVENLGVKVYRTLVYYEMATTYSLAGQHQKAFEYMRKYAMVKDTIGAEENEKQIAEMQTKYETEKKDKELLQKDAEISKQISEAENRSVQRNAFFIGFVLVLILALYILKGYKEKQKANRIILQQKMMVEEKQREVLASIHYAKRIQGSLLPTEKYIDRNLKRLSKSKSNNN